METFGKYRLLERVAIGGMAEIFRATVAGIGGFERTVAIKRMHRHMSEDEELAPMLIDEARLAVQLNHANIGQVFDLGQIDGQYFIVMEYIDGSDFHGILRRLREQNRLIPVPVACHAVAEMLKALDYAHNILGSDRRPLNLVHRDVSPQNLMLNTRGEVKLVDFGIAKARLRLMETQAGIIKGKFYYMSPEQAFGKTLDRRTDIFASGMVLYELLTGRPAYDEVNDLALLKRVRSCDFPSPRSLRLDLDPELDAIILKAVRRDVNERYQTAREFQTVLQDYLHRTTGQLTSYQMAEFLQDLMEPPAQRAKMPEPLSRRKEYRTSEHSLIFDASDLAMPDADEDIIATDISGPFPMAEATLPHAQAKANPFAEDEPTYVFSRDEDNPFAIPEPMAPRRPGASGRQAASSQAASSQAASSSPPMQVHARSPGAPVVQQPLHISGPNPFALPPGAPEASLDTALHSLADLDAQPPFAAHHAPAPMHAHAPMPAPMHAHAPMPAPMPAGPHGRRAHAPTVPTGGAQGAPAGAFGAPAHALFAPGAQGVQGAPQVSPLGSADKTQRFAALRDRLAKMDRRLLISVGALLALVLIFGLVMSASGPDQGAGKAPEASAAEPQEAAPGAFVSLTLISRPSQAQVYIDGAMGGTTPVIVPRQLVGHRAKIKVTKAGYADWEQEVLIHGGDNELAVDLKPVKKSLGVIRVVTHPPDLRVEINDRFIGRSPTQEGDLDTEAQHTVVAYAPDGSSKREVVAWAEGHSAIKEVKLIFEGQENARRDLPEPPRYEDDRRGGARRAPTTRRDGRPDDNPKSLDIWGNKPKDNPKEYDDEEPSSPKGKSGEDVSVWGAKPREAGPSKVEATTGFLSVSVTSEQAQIYVDDKLVSSTGKLNRHSLSVGEHTVKAYFPLIKRYSETYKITITPGQTTRKTIVE